MPAAALSPGFFGKLPSAGDFVTRGLPPAFVASWDRWLAHHLVPRLASDAPPLYFHRPGDPGFVGVVVPSHDSAGRRFPLTLAAARTAASLWKRKQELDPGCNVQPPAALAELATLGRIAIAERQSPDTLAAHLAALSVPGSVWPPRFLLWTDPADLHAAEPETPGSVLDALVGAPAEAG